MMNPSMILIIAFSVVAQVQLSSSIDVNNNTIADAEAARQVANKNLVELEHYAESLIKGLDNSGAVNETMHSIADPVEKLYIDDRARESVEFDTILDSLQKLVRHAASVDVSVASTNISLQDFKKDLANISEQVAAADQTSKRLKKRCKKLSEEEARGFHRGFRHAKRHALDELEQRRHAVDEAASRWKIAARKVQDAERKTQLPENQYERAYDHVEDECDRIRDKAERFAEHAEDKVENHFDKVEDALGEQLDFVHASLSKEEHRREHMLKDITRSLEVFEQKLDITLAAKRGAGLSTMMLATVANATHVIADNCCYSNIHDCDQADDWCSRNEGRCTGCGGILRSKMLRRAANATHVNRTMGPMILATVANATHLVADNCCYSSINDCDQGDDWCSRNEGQCTGCGGTLRSKMLTKASITTGPITSPTTVPSTSSTRDPISSPTTSAATSPTTPTTSSTTSPTTSPTTTTTTGGSRWPFDLRSEPSTNWQCIPLGLGFLGTMSLTMMLRLASEALRGRRVAPMDQGYFLMS